MAFSVEPFRDQRLIYLATPYTLYKKGVDESYRDTVLLLARLMDFGLDVFSPIVHFHPCADWLGVLEPRDHPYWMKKCKPFLDACSALVVPTLEGFLSSKGVLEEMEYYRFADKPVFLLDVEELGF